MYLFQSNAHNPYFNIASEEYLIKNFDDDFFYMYRNTPSIIIGKHQNTLNEINLTYTHKHNIDVVRRISGGGTVYHDLGNLNFSFIQQGEKGKMVDFRKFINPLVEALNSMGIKAIVNKRNDILLNGKKISGNAEHIHRNKTLHHATLLYNADLNMLRNAIVSNKKRYHDKAIQSVRSSVTSVCNEMEEAPGMDIFAEKMKVFFTAHFGHLKPFCLTGEQKSEIENLVKEKYVKWEWNFGYSPNYNFLSVIDRKGCNLTIRLNVKRGIIIKAEAESDTLDIGELQIIEKNLLYMPHRFNLLKEKLQVLPCFNTIEDIYLLF